MGDKMTFYMGSRGNKVPRATRESDTHTTVDGVAKTGETSRHGTVAQTEHRSGRVDANVTPSPVSAKLKVETS